MPAPCAGIGHSQHEGRFSRGKETARFWLPPEPGSVCSTRVRTGRKLAGEGGELPARAGDIAGFDVDLLFEAYQLPVAGARHEGVTGFTGEADHGVVGAQRVAEQALGAKRSRAAFEIFQQRLADAMALPAVVDRQSEFDAAVLERVAGFADNDLMAVDWHRRDHAETIQL